MDDVAFRHAGCFARRPWRSSLSKPRISGKYRSSASSEGSSPRHSSSADRSCVGIASRSLRVRSGAAQAGPGGGAPHGDVVALKGAHDGVELDAELDIALADVVGGRLAAAPAKEGSFECFHVADEVVHDSGDVGGDVERSLGAVGVGHVE